MGKITRKRAGGGQRRAWKNGEGISSYPCAVGFARVQGTATNDALMARGPQKGATAKLGPKTARRPKPSLVAGSECLSPAPPRSIRLIRTGVRPNPVDRLSGKTRLCDDQPGLYRSNAVALLADTLARGRLPVLSNIKLIV